MVWDNNQLGEVLLALHRSTQNLQSTNRDAQIDRLRRANQDNPLHRDSFKVYSQNEEDGIIQAIFDRIGTTNKIFVELGVGDGRENNTLALLFQEWQGLWLEGNPQSTAAIRAGFANLIRRGALQLEELFINKDNVDAAIRRPPFLGAIDLLSIDLDGNDWHIFQAIECVQPRVLVMEYNARFAPPTRYCLPYNPQHQWQGGDNFGVSLQYLVDGLKPRGFQLVACNLTGSNAFFVNEADLGRCQDHAFYKPGCAKTHYQPARYYLSPFPGAHPADYTTLNSLFD